jgi:hypothetical protein
MASVAASLIGSGALDAAQPAIEEGVEMAKEGAREAGKFVKENPKTVAVTVLSPLIFLVIMVILTSVMFLVIMFMFWPKENYETAVINRRENIWEARNALFGDPPQVFVQ